MARKPTKFDHTRRHAKRWDCTKKCAPFHPQGVAWDNGTAPPLSDLRPLSAEQQHIVLVGDIVSGFEAYGPFECGSDAVRWKQEQGHTRTHAGAVVYDAVEGGQV